MSAAQTPTTAPAPVSTLWLALVDDDTDVIDDLAALGISLTPKVRDGLHGIEDPERGYEIDVPDETARIDALASVLLRKLAHLDDDLAQREQARRLEVATMNARYERLTTSARIEREQIEAWIKDLARVQADRGGFGKKRSRDVGYGTYGVKTKAGSLVIADETAFVPWAETEAPELIRVTVKLPLSEARQYLTDAELAATKREVLVTPVREFVAREQERARVAGVVTEIGAPPLRLAKDVLPPGLKRTDDEVEAYAKPDALR